MSDSPVVTRLDNWPKRRRVIYAVLLWMMAAITWLLAGVLDPLKVQIILALIGAIVAIVGGYVFGAVMDDASKRKTNPNFDYEFDEQPNSTLPPPEDEWVK